MTKPNLNSKRFIITPLKLMMINNETIDCAVLHAKTVISLREQKSNGSLLLNGVQA